MSKDSVFKVGGLLLCVALVSAQNLSIGVVAGPHAVTRRFKIEDDDDNGMEIRKEQGGGLFVGPSIVFGVNDNIRISADILMSWGRDTDEDREEETYFSTTTTRITKYTYNEIFVNIPIMGRYRHSLGSVALEAGTGLQLNYWASARSKHETTIRTRNNLTGSETVEREVRERNLLDDNDGINRVSLSIPLIAGATFELGGGELGVYVRWDPMLTNLYDDDDFRQTRTTLGLMAAYYFNLGR